MKKKISIKAIVIGIVISIILYSILEIIMYSIRTAPCDMELVFDSGKRCNHLFQDSIRDELNCIYSAGNSSVANYAYLFNDKYRFVVWELGDFNNVNLNNIRINRVHDIGKIQTKVFNEVKVGGRPTISIQDRICFSMDSVLIFNLSDGSNLSLFSSKVNNRIYLGSINDLGIANNKYENQITFTFSIIPVNCGLVIIKKSGTFYIVLVNSFNFQDSPIEALKYLKLE